MLIQGVRLRENDPIRKNTLYYLPQSRVIPYDEDDSGSVDIDFRLSEGQCGYYAHEYRPATVPQQGAKKADITAFVVDEAGEKAKGCIYEVKKTVGGKNELFDLCEQWMSAVKYWRHSIVSYLEECTVEEEIGVFTVNFEPARIEAEIERLERENAVDFDKVPLIVRGKMALGNLKKYKELEVLRDFLKCRFTYKEGMAIERLTFKISKLDGKERHYLRLEI